MEMRSKERNRGVQGPTWKGVGLFNLRPLPLAPSHHVRPGTEEQGCPLISGRQKRRALLQEVMPDELALDLTAGVERAKIRAVDTCGQIARSHLTARFDVWYHAAKLNLAQSKCCP